MTGVFLSYSRLDQAFGQQVIAGLRALGVECWWDQDMPGVDWQRELERQISQMGGLCVLWTKHSINSDNVRDEARLALDQRKLINMLYEVAQPPFPYDRVNGLPLDGWTGRDPHNGWTRLVKTIEDSLVAVGAKKPGELMGLLARREADIRAGRKAVTDAEDAYAEAKALEGEANNAVEDVRVRVKEAEEQLSSVAQLRASANLLRAAQTDFEDARAAETAAEAEHRTASTRLSASSRALARAKKDLEALFETPPTLLETALAEAGPTARSARAATPPPAELPPEPSEPDHAPAAAAEPAMVFAEAEPIVTAPSAASGNASATTLGGAVPPRPTSPPKQGGGAPIVAIVGGALLLLALIVGVAVWPKPHPVNTGVADSASAAAVSDSTAASSSADSAGTAAAAQVLAGNWYGNLADCQTNPLKIAIDGDKISETLSQTPSTGTLTADPSAHAGASDQLAFKIVFSDGHAEEDYVSADTLTIEPEGGGSITYKRCPASTQ